MISKPNLPNILTSGNLFCGCLALVQIQKGVLVMAAALIGLAAVLDLLDGLVARLMNASSPIGKDLDSLADLVSFGVVPAMTVFALFQQVLPTLEGAIWNHVAWEYFPFLIAVFSGLRLAKFNIDERQAEHFHGLPVPANALFWLSIPLIIQTSSGSIMGDLDYAGFRANSWGFLIHPIFLMSGTLVSSLLLISEIPLFSLKFKNLSWRDNQFKLIFLALSIILGLIFHFKAIPIIVVLYLILSLVQNLLKPSP